MPQADPRFQQGVELFNAGEWYAAHDLFEELWHETADPDRRSLQGLLQVAVAHLFQALPTILAQVSQQVMRLVS